MRQFMTINASLLLRPGLCTPPIYETGCERRQHIGLWQRPDRGIMACRKGKFPESEGFRQIEIAMPNGIAAKLTTEYVHCGRLFGCSQSLTC